ncbi:uncharacterized protein LOC144421981 [Styela clava]
MAKNCFACYHEIKVDCVGLEDLCDRDRSSLCLGKLYKDFISDEEMSCISDVAQLEGSKILYSKLQQLGNVMLGKKSTLTNSVWNIDWRHVLNNMWLKTRKELSKFCSQLDEGTMKQESFVNYVMNQMIYLGTVDFAYKIACHSARYLIQK